MSDIINMLDSLVLFRGIKKSETIKRIIKFYKATEIIHKQQAYTSLLYHLIEKAEENSFDGDILRKQMLNIVICDENVFTLACERGSTSLNGTMSLLATNDMKVIFEMLDTIHNIFLSYPPRDIKDPENFLSHNDNILRRYTPTNWEMTKKARFIITLLDCSDYMDLYTKINIYIKENGCGRLSDFETFILQQKGCLEGVSNYYHETENVIIGYDYQKKIIYDNTERFLNNKSYDNVLLSGERGSGKSTLVKAQAKLFSNRGLRIIEVPWNNVKSIPTLLKYISKRGLKFIIFIDDVAFDKDDKNYKYFKSILEGGLLSRPKNVAYYVTSNRRNLIRETFDYDNDKHEADAKSSKASLKERFGIALQFEKMSPEGFLNTVAELIKIHGVSIKRDELQKIANTHELTNGRNGRSAKQLADKLKNR